MRTGVLCRQHKARQRHQDLAIADAPDFPVCARIESALSHEVKLVEETLDSCFTENAPNSLVGYEAYDCDDRDEHLLDERNIKMWYRIARSEKGLKHGVTLAQGLPAQGEVERMFAWFLNFKHIGIRYEYYADNFRGMVRPVWAMILLQLF